MDIGIIGVGRIGQSLAQAFVRAGHQVRISNRRGGAILDQIAAQTGASASDIANTLSQSDVVVVSLPMHAFESLTPAAFSDKIVVDTCNYYPNRDGHIAELDCGQTTTGEILARLLPNARVVKAFNSILADDLAKGGRLPAGQHALPIAGDDKAAKVIVSQLVQAAGLTCFDAGDLAQNWRFERARPAYCRALTANELAIALANTTAHDFVPEGSWRLK